MNNNNKKQSQPQPENTIFANANCFFTEYCKTPIPEFSKESLALRLTLGCTLGNFLAVQLDAQSKFPKYPYHNKERNKFTRSPEQDAFFEAVRKNPYYQPESEKYPFKLFLSYLARGLNSGLLVGVPNPAGRILVALDLDLKSGSPTIATRIDELLTKQLIPFNYIDGLVVKSPSGGRHFLFVLPEGLPPEELKIICKNRNHQKFLETFGIQCTDFLSSPGSFIKSPFNRRPDGTYQLQFVEAEHTVGEKVFKKKPASQPKTKNTVLNINEPQVLPEKFIEILLSSQSKSKNKSGGRNEPKSKLSLVPLRKPTPAPSDKELEELAQGVNFEELAQGLDLTTAGSLHNNFVKLSFRYFEIHPEFRSSLKTFAINQLTEFLLSQENPQPEENIRRIVEDISDPKYAREEEEEVADQRSRTILLENIKPEFLKYLKLNEKNQLLVFKHPTYGRIDARDYKSLIEYLCCKGVMEQPDPANLEEFDLYTLNSSTHACQKEFYDKIIDFNKKHLHFGEENYGELVAGRVKQRESFPKKPAQNIDLITTHQSHGKATTKLIKTCIFTASKLATNRKQKTKNNLLDPSITPLTPNYQERIQEINETLELLRDHNSWLIEDQSVPSNRYLTDKFGYDCYWPQLDGDGNIINHDKKDDSIALYKRFCEELLPNKVQRQLWDFYLSKTIWQPSQKGSLRCGLILGFYDPDGGTGKSVLLDHWCQMTGHFSLKATDAKTVFGRNNSSLENRIAVFLDEATMENSATAHSKLKNLATSSTLEVQDKYIKKYFINNHAHTAFAVNRTDKYIVGGKERRLRIFDAKKVDKKNIREFYQATQEINFDYFIAQWLKEEVFIPHKVRDFITPDWEQLEFEGEMFAAKKAETDYGGLLFRELCVYTSVENFIEAYQYQLPEIKQPSRRGVNSALLTQENLATIFNDALKKSNIDNHHARGVHITQVIKELRERYLPDFIAKQLRQKNGRQYLYEFQFYGDYNKEPY